jgi:hypothetical protein
MTIASSSLDLFSLVDYVADLASGSRSISLALLSNGKRGNSIKKEAADILQFQAGKTSLITSKALTLRKSKN